VYDQQAAPEGGLRCDVRDSAQVGMPRKLLGWLCRSGGKAAAAEQPAAGAHGRSWKLWVQQSVTPTWKVWWRGPAWRYSGHFWPQRS
jgi:hypothetical protein